MKRLLISLLLLAGLAPLLTSCEDNADESTEYADWAARNAAYFQERVAEARAAIARAQAAHGDDWEAHCDWRLLPTYSLAPGAPATAVDSVCVRILERGTGSGSPLYTDSVRVNYLGRLIPNAYSQDETARTKGRIFDHSGLSRDSADVFSAEYSQPATLLVSNNIEGFSTAVMYMHIGDLWRIYIPQELGYEGSSVSIIPGYSTLVFDVQLKGYYRAGTATSAAF